MVDTGTVETANSGRSEQWTVDTVDTTNAANSERSGQWTQRTVSCISLYLIIAFQLLKQYYLTQRVWYRSLFLVFLRSSVAF